MKKILFILVSLILFGCASQFPAPVDGERKKISKECPDVYTVKKGETIFSISLKCGFDYQELALREFFPFGHFLLGLKQKYFS